MSSDAALNEALPSAVLLETLLSIVATNAAKEAIANAAREADPIHPPYVTVRYKNHPTLYSRDVLRSAPMEVLYGSFTKQFGLDSNPNNGKKEGKSVPGYRYIEYIPMKLYVTFLSGPGAAEKKDMEASGWEASWKGLVPNIDEIHIFTIPEYQERRAKEEMEADQHARGE